MIIVNLRRELGAFQKSSDQAARAWGLTRRFALVRSRGSTRLMSGDQIADRGGAHSQLIRPATQISWGEITLAALIGPLVCFRRQRPASWWSADRLSENVQCPSGRFTLKFSSSKFPTAECSVVLPVARPDGLCSFKVQLHDERRPTNDPRNHF